MVCKQSSVADSRSLKLIDPDALDEREAKVVIERTANDVDQVKRSSSCYPFIWACRLKYFLQGANCDRTFVHGSPHQIHPQIITLHAALVTREQQSGSFKEPSLRNGNRLVLYCGFTGSVRSSYHYRSTLADDCVS